MKWQPHLESRSGSQCSRWLGQQSTQAARHPVAEFVRPNSGAVDAVAGTVVCDTLFLLRRVQEAHYVEATRHSSSAGLQEAPVQHESEGRPRTDIIPVMAHGSPEQAAN